VTAEDDLRAFAAQVLADSNAALSGPVSENVRQEWLDMLALVEDLLALQQQVTQLEARAPEKRE
jgi:hypothetical protein